MAWGAFGDETRTCAVIELLNKEIAVHPADERLLRLRVAAYGQMFDPYSALQDVETLATQHPDSPGMQLQRCLYVEATGAGQNEVRACYLHVAALCERLGKDDALSQEYLLALLLSDSPMGQCLRDTLKRFSRDMLIRRVDPSEIRHPCPKNVETAFPPFRDAGNKAAACSPLTSKPPLRGKADGEKNGQPGWNKRKRRVFPRLSQNQTADEERATSFCSFRSNRSYSLNTQAQ